MAPTQNQTRVAIAISCEVDFKPKLVRRDKQGHFMLIKVAVEQEVKSSINLYAVTVGIPTFIKCALKDIKSYIDPNTVVVGNFKTPL
jgi:hypothetical protein